MRNVLDKLREAARTTADLAEKHLAATMAVVVVVVLLTVGAAALLFGTDDDCTTTVVPTKPAVLITDCE